MTPEATHSRPRCPATDCGIPLAALSERVGEKSAYRPYVDPIDGAALFRCRTHGRIGIHPDGSMRLEASMSRPIKMRRVQ